jgi:hypothetical protein
LTSWAANPQSPALVILILILILHTLCNTRFITSRINSQDSSPTCVVQDSLPSRASRHPSRPLIFPFTPFLFVRICGGIHIQIRIIPIPPLRRTRRRVLRQCAVVPAHKQAQSAARPPIWRAHGTPTPSAGRDTRPRNARRTVLAPAALLALLRAVLARIYPQILPRILTGMARTAGTPPRPTRAPGRMWMGM